MKIKRLPDDGEWQVFRMTVNRAHELMGNPHSMIGDRGFKDTWHIRRDGDIFVRISYSFGSWGKVEGRILRKDIYKKNDDDIKIGNNAIVEVLIPIGETDYWMNQVDK